MTDEAVLYEVKVSNGNGLCTDTESIWVTTNFQPKIDGDTQICQGQGTTLTASGGNSYLWANGAISSSITVLPSDVGTHTYKVQVTAGICSREVSRTITVKAKPTAIILGPDKACYNGSITLTASGTGTYKWSTGATTSSINLSSLQSSQTYGLTITDPITKCSNTDEHVVNVLPWPTLNDLPNSVCAGTSVHLTVSGGSSYSWNVGGSTASIVHSPSEFTEYRVTVTDANGCVYSLSKSVNVEALPRVTFGGGTSICEGQSLNVTAFGGQSYRWDYNNSKTATITVSPTQNTTYTVTATSAGGCTSSAQRVIQVKTPATGAIVGASSICPGQSLTLTASGVGTYRWSENNATTSSIQVSPSQNTTYSLLITNAEGCTFQTSHSVSVNITGSASNDGPLTCSKTTALLQANTGAAGASFSWRNASGVEIARSANTSVNTPGVYSLVITGAGGCSYTTATEVLVNRVNPSMTLSQNGPITCTKPNVVLSASPSTPGASYAWQWRNSAGTVLGTAASIGVSQPGVYTLRATDTNGCTAEQSLSVGADVTPPVLSTVSNDGPLSCTKTNVVLSASSSTAGVTYTWKNAGGTPLGYNASTSVSTAGTYVVEVQGSNGCKISQSTQVGQTGTFPNISVNQPAPISCTSPQTWVSGGSNTTGVTYEWRNANNRVVATQSGFNAQMPGEYTLKVTAPNGCSSSSLVMVEDEVWVTFDWLIDGKAINFWENANYQSRSITCSKSSVSVGLPGSNSSNGTFVLITPQGSSLNMYPGNTRTLTLPGAYRLEMTQSGCTRRKELLIVEDRTPPVVKIEGNTELCGSGSTTLLASGGNKYKWSTGATTASLALGTLSSTSSYTVTVTGLNGCTASKTATVSIHPIPQATPQHAGAFCLDAGQPAVGTLAVSASGGTAPYSYRWDNGQSTAGVSVSSPSSLSMGVTVTDSKGCFTTTSASLVVNRRPYAQILGGEMACAGESPTLTASGGSTFLWSNNATSSSIAIIQPTQNQTYSVSVSNVPGCVGVASKTVVVPAALSVGHTTAGTDDCVANNAQVIPSLSGGTGNITLSLFRSGEVEPLPSSNGLKSGTYLLKAQDSKGCTAQREVVIVETPIEISALTLSKVDDCIPGNTQVNISTKGDRLPLVYRLDGVVQSGATITLPREEKTYSIEVADAAGCVVSREEYYEDYDAVRVYEENISPVTDCSTPNGAIHFVYVGKPGTEQKDYSISVDGGTTWHQATNLVLNLRPGMYQTAARNDLVGCVVQGPQVQITAPYCLPEAGFTKSTLHITSPTQRIALPWRVDKRAWGNADKPFSLHIYRVEDGKPHFVDPNIATATEPLEKRVEPGAGFTIEYAVDFAGSDERELVLQPNAKDHLEPGFYTFLMEGEGVDVDPFRKKITVIVDLDGRVIVDPLDACPGIDITLTVEEGECWNWEGLNQPNQRSITVKHVQGRIYKVHYLENLVKKTKIFIGDDQIDIPVKLTGIEEMCPGDSYYVSWRYKDNPFPTQESSIYAAEWKVEWVPNNTSERVENIPNSIKVSPTETTTYKILVTYIPTGCKFELAHTVEVDDLFEKAGIKAKENSKILCDGNGVILDIENPKNVNLVYTWTSDNGFKSYSNPPLKVNVSGKYTLELQWLGKSCKKIIEFDVQSNNPCEIKEYFEKNGFYAIPINIHSRPQAREAELRSPCLDGGEQVKDDAGPGFNIQGDPEAIDLKGIFESSLSHFSSCFGYTSSQALISENTDICSCDDYLPKAEERMQKSGLQYWSHVFEGQDCDGQDYLFIKAKMPDGSEYGSNGAEFLNAGLNYALQVAQNKGGRMGMGLILDHMLDNFVEAKTATVFSQTPPQKLPEPKKELETLFQPSCIDGKNFISANVFAADGKLIQLPPETVWRFKIASNVKVTEGVLTGYTLFKDGAIIGIYSGRKKINTEDFLGYYLRGAFTNICIPESFEVPGTDDNGFLYADVGNLVTQRFVDYANCGQSFEISLVHMWPNQLAVLPGSATVTPKGKLFTGKFSDLAYIQKGVPQFSSKPVYSYSICPEALGDVASNVGTDYSRLGVNLFYNAAESSVMYQIKDSKGNPLWLYVRAEPGTYVNGCQDKFTYYIWNCKLAIWQEINPNDPTFKNDCELIQKLFKALENSQLLHKTLSDVSFIPIVGDIASLANGIIYLAEGDIGRGKTELFWAVVGVAGELVPFGKVALRLVNKVGGALSPGIAKIIAIVKLVPCQGVPSLVETEVLGACRIAERILDAARTSALNAKLQELGFKFSDATTKLMTDFIHNNRLGSAFHTWLKDANVEHLAVIFKTGLEDLKWPVTKLEDLVDDLMRIPSGLLEKMAKNPNLIKAWDVLSASPLFRQNEVYLERLASLGFDWAKLKSSFATALSKGDEEHLRKWMELKIPQADLEKAFKNGLNDTPGEYIPYSPAHKAQRWEQYKARIDEEGGTRQTYEAWSNGFDGGIDRTVNASKTVDDYYNANGWMKPPVYKEYPFKAEEVGTVTRTTSKGNPVTGGRRHDIYDASTKKATEIKDYSDKVYKTEDIEMEALKDAHMLQEKKLNEVEWIFKSCPAPKDCGPSGPLRSFLENLGIKVTTI